MLPYLRLHALLPFLALPFAHAMGATDDRFLSGAAAVAIYRDGWNDLNKNGAKDPYEDPALEIEKRIDDLLGRMTSDEKTAQMVTLYGFPRVLKDEVPTERWSTAFWKDGIGNIDEHANGNTGWTNNLADPEHDLPYSRHTRLINEIQRWFVERTRLGIPVDFTNEGIRGLLHSRATSFPAQLAVASTWNPTLARQIGEITGKEARALGYTNIYSPVLDVSRDPRWGRIIESYGEDPYLIGAMGLAQVQGLQSQGVASTLKHFAIYSVPKGGRDGHARTDPQVTWREVQMIFLPPFKKAIVEGRAMGVMSSYNDYNGVPVQSSRLFLTEILREQWGFRGYVVSDSAAVEFLHTKHRVAGSPEEAVRQAVNAGLNVRTNFTPPEEYGLLLRKLVSEGRLAGSTIDARVRDVLRVKFQLGLFDRPYVPEPARADETVRQAAHLEVALRAARESIVLLKNDRATLPLKLPLRKVLVAGPLANDPHGWWSRYGAQRLEFVTPLNGLREALGPNVEVRYAKGVDVKDAAFPESDVYKEPAGDDVKKGIEAAVRAADGVDVIVCVLGETDELCRESASRVSLNLPGYQEELLQALHATGRPIVLVLSNGRPLSINWAAKHVPAIVEMWFPGEAGGTALAEVLLGKVNPAGRLPVTFPKSVGQIPYNFPTHPGAQDKDPGQVEGALFSFGHGLSYSKFEYSGLEISPKRQPEGGRFAVEFDLANVSDRDGDEVVQLYLRDDYSSVVTFEKVLRGFRRVHLKAGEKQRIKFELTPADLEIYGEDDQWVVEPGRFTVMVGASSTDIRLEGHFEVLGATARLETALSQENVDPR